MKIDPKQWESGCAVDEVRNRFVVPLLKTKANERRPNMIADIGCGTGYISRKIHESVGYDGCQWLLVDSNKEMLEFAATQFRSMDRIELLYWDLLKSQNSSLKKKIDMAIICYTLIEVENLQDFMRKLSHLLCANAVVDVVLPDVLEDVEKQSHSDPDAWVRFRNGCCRLSKRDKFTEIVQHFYANRLEHLLQVMISTGLYLTEIHTYLTEAGRRHFCYQFHALKLEDQVPVELS